MCYTLPKSNEEMRFESNESYGNWVDFSEFRWHLFRNIMDTDQHRFEWHAKTDYFNYVTQRIASWCEPHELYVRILYIHCCMRFERLIKRKTGRTLRIYNCSSSRPVHPNVQTPKPRNNRTPNTCCLLCCDRNSTLGCVIFSITFLNIHSSHKRRKKNGIEVFINNETDPTHKSFTSEFRYYYFGWIAEYSCVYVFSCCVVSRPAFEYVDKHKHLKSCNLTYLFEIRTRTHSHKKTYTQHAFIIPIFE